jgi:hypothetical protein
MLLVLDRNDEREPCSWVPGRNREMQSIDIYQELTPNFCSSSTDPLVHYGRHFGRTVHALCTVTTLLNNGLLRMGELLDQPDDAFTHEYVF